MDELVIGEKKYISSKQAAKATGYAKDYVGQLCREGRVPARLVGRSWYVLESAIHDHRFGETSVSGGNKEGTMEKASTTPSSAWESPRYEASEPEVLPSVNRLREESEQTGSDDAQRLQDSWKAWFDRFDHVAAPTQEREEIEQSVDIPVPIRAIHHQHYQPLPVFEEPVPRQRQEAMEEQDQEERMPQRETRSRRAVSFRIIQLAGVLFAFFMIITAVLGSGYLDKYILSVSQARIIAGVSLYNR